MSQQTSNTETVRCCEHMENTSGQTSGGRGTRLAVGRLKSLIHTGGESTYCERGEGHAHPPETIESQGNEDENR